MGFFLVVTLALLIAVVVAWIFTVNTNYLDPNINTNLDLTKHLGLHGQFTERDRYENTQILRKSLNAYRLLAAATEQYKIREEQTRQKYQQSVQ